MPRRPDPNSKTAQIIFKANDETEEIKIRALKEICARNNIDIRDVFLPRVDSFLREHHWPPGSSQTLLVTYGGIIKALCTRCHRSYQDTELVPVEFISGMHGNICKECLRKDEEGPRLVKKRLL